MSWFRAGSLGNLLFLGACASFSYQNNAGHSLMDQHRFAEAAQAFSEKSKTPGQNQLLYLMDAGVAYFDAHEYESAIQQLLEAEKIAEIKDYTSLSEEAGSLATSDAIKQYRGEDFEKVLINVYLALSYAALEKWEDAQVEARKINLILYRMIHEGKRNYEESPFARYLSGMIWEAAGEWDDAYVDFQYVQKLNPSFPNIGSDLIELAGRLGMRNEESEWRQQYPTVPLKKRRTERTEVVVIFERGNGPIKVPREEASSLPRMEPRFNSEAGAKVLVDGVDYGNLLVGMDIENTSIRYLEDRMGKMIARKMLGAAVKGAIAAGVTAGSDDHASSALAVFQLLMLFDQADLRNWRSLPADIQFLRIPVSAGTHEIRLQTLDYAGKLYRELSLNVTIRRNQTRFIPLR
jgi:hypothetical protein